MHLRRADDEFFHMGIEVFVFEGRRIYRIEELCELAQLDECCANSFGAAVSVPNECTLQSTFARVMSLLNSRSQSTELATAMQRSQSHSQTSGREGVLQKRHVDHGDVERERKAERAPEPADCERDRGKRSLVRARVEDVEELKQHQRRERHRLRIAHVA